MHVLTKVTLGIGGFLLLTSVASLVIGGVSISDTSWWDDDSIGDEYWTGETSTSFSEKLNRDAYYLVYVEEGYEVDIEIYEGSNGGWGYFESCEEYDDCEEYDQIPGYDYIGEINVDASDDFEIEFTENESRSVDVMIREEKVPFTTLMGMGGGLCGLCCSLLLLIIGGIMALILKDKTKVQTTIQIDNEIVVDKDESNETLYDQDRSG